MFGRYALLFALTAALCAFGSGGDVPPALTRWTRVTQAQGTFVQRKTLADVEVTLVSSGTFRFEKDKSLEWRTLRPLESVFVATPEKYALTAAGRTSEHRLSELKLSAGLRALLNGDFTALPQSFEVSAVDDRITLAPRTRELREFVKRLELEGKDFPSQVTVEYVSGDRLQIELHRDGESK